MAQVPQFDFPFRFAADGLATVVEQDSVDDIANCVEAVLRTRVGDRLEFPEFGSMDLQFMEQPIPVEQLAAQIRQWEPRVDLLIEQDWDLFEETLVRLNIQIAKGD